MAGNMAKSGDQEQTALLVLNKIYLKKLSHTNILQNDNWHSV